LAASPRFARIVSAPAKSLSIVIGEARFVKVRYRRLAKNAHRLVVTSALANLFMARRHLLRCQQV
jgi:hypothetical protein